MQVQVCLTIELSASASLSQMEEQIQQAGQQAMRQAFKQAIRKREELVRTCPHCGSTQRRLEGTTRRVVATTFGKVELAPRRFRCQSCLRRWCPAKPLLAELAGTSVSRPLQEAAHLAGASWPYRVAAGLLRKLSGAQISAEEIRLLTNREGQRRASRQQQQAEQSASAVAKAPAGVQKSEPPPAEQEPLLVGVDGGWVGSREQRGGMEGKVAVLSSQVEDLPLATFESTFSWSQRGARRPAKQRHRLAQRRYVATFGSGEQLGKLSASAARQLDASASRPVVMLADGANWIKTQQRRHFPQATCILDWAHLWREVNGALRAVGRAKQWPQSSQSYHRFVVRTWLWHGKVDQAIEHLSRLSADLEPEALKRLKQAMTYLENQRGWIGSYEQWQKQGYPVGSGMIERAVAIVINRRMKRRGMRWRRLNATGMVALRTDLRNSDWITPQRLRTFP